jgi:hypothetical protein
MERFGHDRTAWAISRLRTERRRASLNIAPYIPLISGKIAIRQVNLPLVRLELRPATLPQTGGVEPNRHSTLRVGIRGQTAEPEDKYYEPEQKIFR